MSALTLILIIMFSPLWIAIGYGIMFVIVSFYGWLSEPRDGDKQTTFWFFLSIIIIAIISILIFFITS